jgi:hypothetical protein
MSRFLCLLCGALFLLPLTCALSDETTDDSTELLHYTEKDLPTDEKDPAGVSEIEEFAKGRGFRYGRDTRRAARGDQKALKAFFQLAHDADGAAAESINGVPAMVFHLLGDKKFAQFLAAQPLPYRMMVRDLILGHGFPYLSRYFPETTRLLFQREMTHSRGSTFLCENCPDGKAITSWSAPSSVTNTPSRCAGRNRTFSSCDGTSITEN